MEANNYAENDHYCVCSDCMDAFDLGHSETWTITAENHVSRVARRGSMFVLGCVGALLLAPTVEIASEATHSVVNEVAEDLACWQQSTPAVLSAEC